MTATRFRHATIALGFDTGPDSRLLVTPNGEFTTGNLPLRLLIGFAYDLQDAEITGPESLDSERYSIAAQADRVVPEKDVGPFRLMVRALLAERFGLEFHRETQRVRAFGLDRVTDVLMAKSAAASEPGPFLERRGSGSIRVSNARLAPLFTSWLATRLGARVINRTGLLGSYTFDLAWAEEQAGRNHEPLEAALKAQLGLAVEALDVDIERLVVDHVARPADLQPRPVAIEVDAATLDRYVGRYTLPGASVMTISRDEGRLFAGLDGQGRVEIFAANATEFFPKVFQARIEFLVDERGAVTALVLHQGGRVVQAARVADAARQR
jgi:uncharacterized protein (TIGR03435 family)